MVIGEHIVENLVIIKCSDSTFIVNGSWKYSDSNKSAWSFTAKNGDELLEKFTAQVKKILGAKYFSDDIKT